MAIGVPVLIVSDAVSSPTGLGRIAREIAIRANADLKDVCRIATLGYGGPGSRKLLFSQYNIEGMGRDFIIPNLSDVWDDWAGDERGIIWFIWDPSRIGWFSRPDNAQLHIQHLSQFLRSGRFKRWIYAPVDGDGPNGRLSFPVIQGLLGFDRILAYGGWGEGIIRGSLGNEASKVRDLCSIPHAIDPAVFYPRNRVNSRMNFFALTRGGNLRGTQTAILEDEVLIGTVATNQTRKDWGLWAESCALFLSRHPKTRFWIHLDQLERYWSIPSLLMDYNLIDKTIISLAILADEQMAQAYSACDLTLGIGPEGFGFPVFESLFCGTPCVTGDYGGAAEHFRGDLVDCLITPVAYRLEGLYAVRRPVYAAKDWVDCMDAALGKKIERPEHLGWKNVWPRFAEWIRRGLA